jgi:hypothetical protein
MSSDVFRRSALACWVLPALLGSYKEPLKAQEVSNMLYGMQGHEQ